MDFTMESLESLSALAAAQASDGGAGESVAASNWGVPVWTWIVGGALLALAIGTVARRSGRRPSIGY
jgi:hypothetical protein